MQIPLAAPLALALGLVSLTSCRDAPRPPAALPPAPDVVLTPPLHDAALGEEIVLRRGRTEWLYRVAEDHDTDVVVEVIVYEDGVPQGKPQRFRWDRNGFGVPDDLVIASIEPTRLEQDGASLPCWLVQGASPRGTFAFWIGEDAPVHGLLRMAKVEGGRPVEAGALVRVR